MSDRDIIARALFEHAEAWGGEARSWFTDLGELNRDHWRRQADAVLECGYRRSVTDAEFSYAAIHVEQEYGHSPSDATDLVMDVVGAFGLEVTE